MKKNVNLLHLLVCKKTKFLQHHAVILGFLFVKQQHTILKTLCAALSIMWTGVMYFAIEFIGNMLSVEIKLTVWLSDR